jgi:hypothetical protein
MSDVRMATIARNLAEALSDFAYSRKDEDKKRVSSLQFQLCAEWRKEQAEMKE